MNVDIFSIFGTAMDKIGGIRERSGIVRKREKPETNESADGPHSFSVALAILGFANECPQRRKLLKDENMFVGGWKSNMNSSGHLFHLKESIAVDMAD